MQIVQFSVDFFSYCCYFILKKFGIAPFEFNKSESLVLVSDVILILYPRS